MKHTSWKIYAVAISLLTLYAYISAPFEGATDWIDFAVTIVALTGLMMFAFLRKFLVKPFWGLAAFGFTGWTIYYFFFSPYATNPIQLDTIISVVLQLPIVAALFIYGFGASYIWKAPPEKDSQGQDGSEG